MDILYLFIAFIASVGIYALYKRNKINKQIKGLSNKSIEMTPEEFKKMRNFSFGGRGTPKYALKYNFKGVYILYNKTKNMYYIGQANKVINRVNAHFTGRGNGDVYADFKYGDEFTIKAISLQESGYSSLNSLERDTIKTYDAFAHGYNKTRGNK
ncbi:MAG: GIY-YIG nuclease family protein [Clostridia bacterium]|nr:GIY-YIG nuclease family protein [Clostridia bacterium]